MAIVFSTQAKLLSRNHADVHIGRTIDTKPKRAERDACCAANIDTAPVGEGLGGGGILSHVPCHGMEP
jgi:hypothetical protein